MSAKLPGFIQNIHNLTSSTENILEHEHDFRSLNLPRTPEEIQEHNESLYHCLDELDHCNMLCKELLADNSKSKNVKEILNRINQEIIPEKDAKSSAKPN